MNRFPFIFILFISMGLLISIGKLMAESTELAYKCQIKSGNVAECRLKYFGR